MSVAQGHEASVAPDDDAWAPVETAEPAPVVALPTPPRPGRSTLPPRPVPASPLGGWVQALRLRAVPTALLGAAVAGLVAARGPATRPGLLALAVVLLVLSTGLAGLLRDLGDARPDRAGPLRRVEAGRAVIALVPVCAVLLGVLVVVRDGQGLLLAAVGVVALLLALSRRSGVVLSTVGGLLAGGTAAALAGWAATGSVDPLVALLAGSPVAGLLAARRSELGARAARAVVLLPYAAAGGAVAAGVVPLPVLAVVLALPSARTAARARTDAAPVVAGHSRLFAAVLVVALLVAAVAGV